MSLSHNSRALLSWMHYTTPNRAGVAQRQTGDYEQCGPGGTCKSRSALGKAQPSRNWNVTAIITTIVYTDNDANKLARP